MKERRDKRKKNLDSTGLTVLYYVFQYFFVWVWFFGFKRYPSLLDFFVGFNLGGILGFVTKIFDYFVLAFTIGDLYIAILLLIPYALAFLWECRRIFLFFFALLSLVRALYCYIRYRVYKKSVLDLSKYVIVKCGAPGTGKSSSAFWQAVETAKKLWIELQDKYFLLLRDVKRVEKRGELLGDKLKRDFKEVKAAYMFYKTNPCVPCLWTNIPVMVDGLLFESSVI
jgi:hypothetical protein